MEGVEALDDAEDHKGHDEEVQNGVDKVAQAVHHKGRVAVGPGQPFGVLHHMGVGADDNINALISQPLGGLLLEVVDLVRAFGAHVGADDEHITVGAHIGNLLGNRLPVVEVHNAVLRARGRRQAVRVFGVGEVAESDAVDGLVDVVVVGAEIVKAHRDDIVRHGGPVRHGSLNTCRTLVVAVIVGQAEHPESQIIQRVGDGPGR